MNRPAAPDDRWDEIWAVFHRVLERPPEEREKALNDACGEDAAVRREVEELLAAHEEGSPVLDGAPPVSLPAEGPDEPQGADGDATATALWEGELLAPGTVLAGRFTIVRRIGAGGMGEVYEAEDRELGRRVALKTLLAGGARSRSSVARFRQEIHLAQQVTHRNVCRVFDLARDRDTVFLTMELLDGETLAERLGRRGRLSLDESRGILEQVAAALEAAHGVGVVHRDLKPSNVLLVEEPSGPRAVVTDFGLATAGGSGGEETALTRTGEVLGTPAYMAPEQLEGRPVAPATDVYALGLLLYEMVTGRRPFTGGSAFSLASRRLEGPPPSPRAHLPGIDARWEEVILRCLARHPADRFQHPREVVAALRDPSTPLPLAAGRRRARWAWWGAAAGAIALLGVALLWWQDHRGPSRAAPELGVAGAGAAGAESEGEGFEERDALIVARFDNRSGEPSLDGVLEPALVHALSRSTFVGLASRDRIADTLRLMRQPADSALDVALARQVAVRDGGIRAVVGGRVERKGPALGVTAELLAPADGAVLAGWSEAAEGVAGVQDALGRIALRIREYLGENPGQIEASGRRFEKVTTPSLRALRLYDEADAAIAEDRPAVAEELLHEALREDPDFASAHILLAHALRNQGRPLEESLPHAQRAMELADEVPDRERYFIRGSYFSFVDDHDRMLASYRALHRLHPDHYWATNNLANWLWRLEGPEAALPYVLARARLRPNGFGPTLMAAQALILVRGRPQEAQPYVERLVDLAAVVELPYYRTDEAAWARLWGAHRHWLRGDVEAARSELDRWAGALEALPGGHGNGVRQLLVRGYRTLGLAARAMELAPLPEFRLTRPYFRGVDAYLGGDPDAVMAELAGEAWEEDDWNGGIWRDPVRVAALARSGRVGDARAVVKTFRERPSPAPSAVITPPMMEARLRGEIELAEGRPGEAARLLEREAFGSWNDYRLLETAWIEWYGSSYFLAAQALAIAYRRLGRDEDALSVLERAVAERARSYPNGTELWLDTQLRLARLHRELGNAAEAERLENELRDLMRQADPDFWLVRALERTAPR